MRPAADPPAPLGLEPSPGNPRFEFVDPLRGLAAVAVVASHLSSHVELPGPLQRLASHGNGGVALFFMISGFLLYRPYASARLCGTRAISPKRFYQKRLLRIVPGYWMALTVLAIYPGLPQFANRWWIFYSFGQIYTEKTGFAGLSVAWSLAVEMSFYLAVPLYARFASRFFCRAARPVRRELIVLALAAVASLGVRAAIKHEGREILSYCLPATFYLFAVGMALALVTTTGWWQELGQFRWLPWLLSAAGAIGYTAFAVALPDVASSSVNPGFVPIALLLLLSGVLPRPSNTRPMGPLVFLGEISYGIYLWHVGVFTVAFREIGIDKGLAAAVGLLSTLLVAAGSYFLIEAPFLRLKRGIDASSAGDAKPA